MKKKILFCFAVIMAAIMIVGSFTLNASSGANCTGPKELVDGQPKCLCTNTAPCSDMQGCKSKARQATIKIAQ